MFASQNNLSLCHCFFLSAPSLPLRLSSFLTFPFLFFLPPFNTSEGHSKICTEIIFFLLVHWLTEIFMVLFPTHILSFLYIFVLYIFFGFFFFLYHKETPLPVENKQKICSEKPKVCFLMRSSSCR